MLARTGLPVGRILHCAQSLYHDVRIAKSLGFTTVWVDRRAGRAGGGATPASDATPDFVVPDLAGLAALMGAA
jgi:2-haloacid dehalogenase